MENTLLTLEALIEAAVRFEEASEHDKAVAVLYACLDIVKD